MRWATLPLNQMGSVARGRSRHRPRNDPALYGGDFPFFQTGDVTAAEFYLSAFSQTYNAKGLAQSRLWQSGTLCITIAANIAESAVLAISGCFPDSVVGFQADKRVSDIRFVKYALDGLKAGFQTISKGTTQPNLSVDKLLSIPFPAPPLETQRRIAGILSAYDDLIENNTRRIAILEDMARRLFEEWFASGGQSGEWTTATLGDWMTEVRDAVDPNTVDPETPYVGLEHLPRRATTMTEWGVAGSVGSTKLAFQRGDVLFGKIRPYFHKVAVAPKAGVSSSDAIVMRPHSAECLPAVLAVTSSDGFVAHATQTSNGTKMPRANWSVLKDYPLPRPPKAVLGRFNALVEPSIWLCAKLAEHNATLRAARDLLLPKLISGEIDVSRAEAVAELAPALAIAAG